jgi:hypothetical protein
MAAGLLLSRIMLDPVFCPVAQELSADIGHQRFYLISTSRSRR